MEASKDLYELLAAMPVGCAVVNAKTREITYANTAVTRLLRYDLAGKTLDVLAQDRPLVSPAGAQIPMSRFATFTTITTGEPAKLTAGFRPDAESLIWLEVQTVPLEIDGTDLVVVTFTDVSGILEAQHAMGQAFAALQETYELQQQFVANVSHELRTPLSIMLGYSEVAALNSPATCFHLDYWQHIRKAATRMKWLVENILGVGKLESGTAVKEHCFSLHDIALESALGLQPIAKANGVALHFGRMDSPTPVLGNEHLTALMVNNLIHNAIKFAPGGDVFLELVRDGANTILTILDNGVGITDSVAQVMFEKFRQGDGTDTRSYGGTGIGLYFVKLVVDFHGWEISYHSIPGAGTLFKVVFNGDGC